MTVEELNEEINIELELLGATLQELSALNTDVADREPNVREKTAAAAFLAQFYGGIENILNTSFLKIFGEVDFLHAFRQASIGMIENAEEREVFDSSLKIKVLKPEDIIGLKLQAIKNNPSRKQKELEDIEFLLSNYKDKMDFALIEKYVEILEMKDVYNEIFRRMKDENF